MPVIRLALWTDGEGTSKVLQLGSTQAWSLFVFCSLVGDV